MITDLSECKSSCGVQYTCRIPFGKSIRVTGETGPGAPDKDLFWCIICGKEDLPVELGGAILPGNARLILYILANHTAKPLEEFAQCDVKGSGALYQVPLMTR